MLSVDVEKWIMVRWDCFDSLLHRRRCSLPIRLLTCHRTVGNALFRQAVADRWEEYTQHQQTKNRRGMASVIQAIADEVHKAGGRFMDQDWRGMVSWMVGVQTYILFMKHTRLILVNVSIASIAVGGNIGQSSTAKSRSCLSRRQEKFDEIRWQDRPIHRIIALTTQSQQHNGQFQQYR
jgi:hypothetical protein